MSVGWREKGKVGLRDHTFIISLKIWSELR